MSKIPVVFTFDKRIIPAGAIAVKSMIDCAKAETEYDIYVFHPDITEKVIGEFEKMFSSSRHHITFTKVAKERFKSAPKSRGSWREIVYYRILIPELLPQYDKVIYSDVDVLFKDDLSELYATDLDGFEWGGIAAERNTHDAAGHKYFPENTHELIFWSGFMLLNTKYMRENNFVDRCFNVIRSVGDRLKFFDLDTINIASHVIKPLPLRYVALQSLFFYDKFDMIPEYVYLKNVYSLEQLSEAKNTPAIIHYAGKPGKPWRLKQPPADYRKYMDELPKKLRKYTFRDFRKKLFSKN